ncbi:hypothetical protein EVAR_5062_1 [Eumeta japonica]|uniref:Pre-C2HC domain-containing protein n=1 Tax=Eumeta variegata TaxID=151549 RepID=A0A4C1SUW1_EUMVA|nr:hypothetical protein EVAR_5062_1 [Eumeta japonica]
MAVQTKWTAASYKEERFLQNNAKWLTAVPDFRNLSTLLATLKVAHHTYSLKEKREFRVVLREVPKELPIEEIKEYLLAQDLPVQSVRRITNHAREPLNLALVIFYTSAIDNTTKCSSFNIKVWVGDYGTGACTGNKETDGPSACVLCKSSSHTANYLGCPRAPKRKIIPNNSIIKNLLPAQAAPHRKPANISYAKMMAGLRKELPKNIPNDTSTEDIKVLLSV